MRKPQSLNPKPQTPNPKPQTLVWQERDESSGDPVGVASGSVMDCFAYDAANKESYTLVAACARDLKADLIVVKPEP